MTAIYLVSQGSPFGVIVVILGLCGLALSTIWMADSKQTAGRNVSVALLAVVAVALLIPDVLCCWCPPDPSLWDCIIHPWCCS